MEELEIRYDEDRGSESLRDKIMSTSALKEALNVLITMFRELRACEIAGILRSSPILASINRSPMHSGTELHQWLINDLTHVGAFKISFSQPDWVGEKILITVKAEFREAPVHDFHVAEFVLVEVPSLQIRLHRIGIQGRWYS